MLVFFFNATATTEIYTLSLHDALPISKRVRRRVWLVFRNLFCYLPIESACANDLFDRARNEILNRAAAGDPVPNFGCGNIDSPIHTQIFVDDRVNARCRTTNVTIWRKSSKPRQLGNPTRLS